MTALRERIRSGELLLGTFLDLGSAEAAQIAGAAGVDWLVIDLEHGAGGRAATQAQLQAAGVPAIVRVPSAASEQIGWSLDFGAAGLVVPRVHGPEEAAQAEAATRYSAGRGVHAAVPSARFGLDPDFAERSDRELVLMIQIETRGALAAVDEIAAVEGVDVLFVGPYDLGNALGVTPGPETPEVLRAAERTATAAREAGKAAAVFLGDPSLARRYRDLGFTLLASGSTGGMLAAAVAGRISALRA